MKKDLGALQGTWSILSLELDGQKMPAAAVTGSKIVIQGKRFKTIAMGATYEGTIELDPTKTPKVFDLRFSSGPEAGNKSVGIYQLDEDTWKICLTTRGADRPKEFGTKPGTGHAFETLKRESLSAASDDQSGEAAPSPGSRTGRLKTGRSEKALIGEPTELEGEWSMVAGTSSGQPFDPNGLAYGQRITRGNETTVLFGEQVYMKVSFTVDSSSAPKRIDYVYISGPNRGKKQHGIYETDGKTVKLCVSAVGQERPDDFTSTPEDGRMLTIWTLNKK